MKESIFSDDDRQYLQMMQDIINRMANNSANCKSWMITLMSGFLALGCSIKDFNEWTWIAVFPVIIFWYLDSYYLQIERKIRNRELYFILKAKENNDINIYNKALYDFKPLNIINITIDQIDQGYKKTDKTLFNLSVLPIYGGSILIIIIISLIIN